MNNVIRVAIAVSACILSGGGAARAAEARLAADTPAAYAAAFAERTGDWKANAEALEGRGPLRKEIPGVALGDFVDDAHTYFVVKGVNLWRHAFGGEAAWQDYAFETTVRVLDPAPLDGVRPGQDNVFMNYQWGREAIGSDVGLIVRYQGPDRYYMVRLSTAYQHVELWKTKGGVVRVKPFPLKVGTDYRVAVSAHGPWITVAIDGQEVLTYADPVEPIPAGRVGVAVRESRVAFSKANVVPIAGKPAPVPAHEPNFQLRDWIGRRYIFDGDEPVANFSKLGALQEVKLVPGLMPMILLDTVPRWGDLQGTAWKAEPPRFTFGKTGETFTFFAEREEPNGLAKGSGDWILSYDPARGYVWDFRGRVDVLVDGKVKKWCFDLIDPCFYQTVAPATTKLPQGRTDPNFCLYLRADGKHGWFPANHQFPNCGNPSSADQAVKKGGFVGTTVDDWAFVAELPEDNAHEYWFDYCGWGLDQHVMPLPARYELAAKGEAYQGHIRLFALPPARVRQIISEGVLRNDKPENRREMLAHVEPVNRFDDVVPAVAGDSKVRWLGVYSVDRAVGRGDKVSMRLDVAAGGAPLAVMLDAIGPSMRTGPYLAAKYRIGCWVKADAFKGKVTVRMDTIAFAKAREHAKPEASLEIAGATDWKFVGFETEFPHLAHLWRLTVEASGEGTLWVDDFEITPEGGNHAQ